jgi:exodeoxyribonuclease VII large subunit
VPSGEGTIKKAFDLLKAKLEKEGLFDEARKRSIPSIPIAIGVITSQESAAYADFIKIINARWPFLHVTVFDIQVQGEQAANQIVAAISDANQHADQLDMIVITRGGGSADDLQAFNDEQVVRAVAASRIPTIVAIGHEIDISLAELASDLRASTPSNAAELITPNVRDELRRAEDVRKTFTAHLRSIIATIELDTKNAFRQLGESIIAVLEAEINSLQAKKSLLEAYNPAQVLLRGYSIVAKEGSIVKSVHGLRVHDTVTTTVNDGSFDAQIVTIHKKEA